MALSQRFKAVITTAVLAAAVGIAAVTLKTGSTSPVQEPVQPQQLPRNIDVALHNALFTEMRNGIAVWELLAGRAEYDKKSEVAYLTDIRMKFNKTRSGGAITVTAASGEYSEKAKLVKLRGKVHLVSDDGLVFDTETLDYQTDRARFRTAAKVSFSQQRLTLTAIGMTLDTREQKAHFGSSIDAAVEGLKVP